MTRRSWVADVVGLAVAVVLVFPVYWMVITAFKPGVDILTYTPRFLPSAATLDNFRDALARPNFWSSVGNSVVVTLSTVAISLVVAFAAALAVARLRFRGRAGVHRHDHVRADDPADGAWSSRCTCCSTPSARPTSSPGSSLTYLAFVLPFTVWTLRGFVANVPVDLEEAAMVDGCTPAAGVPAGRLPARRARPGRHQRLRLHPGVERVRARLRHACPRPEKQTHHRCGWRRSPTQQGHRVGRR